MTLSCQELVDLIMDFTDGSLPAELRAFVEEHLCGCPSCDHVIATYRATIVICRALPKSDHVAPLSPAFEARLRALLGRAESVSG